MSRVPAAYTIDITHSCECVYDVMHVHSCEVANGQDSPGILAPVLVDSAFHKPQSCSDGICTSKENWCVHK